MSGLGQVLTLRWWGRLLGYLTGQQGSPGPLDVKACVSKGAVTVPGQLGGRGPLQLKPGCLTCPRWHGRTLPEHPARPPDPGASAHRAHALHPTRSPLGPGASLQASLRGECLSSSIPNLSLSCYWLNQFFLPRSPFSLSPFPLAFSFLSFLSFPFPPFPSFLFPSSACYALLFIGLTRRCERMTHRGIDSVCPPSLSSQPRREVPDTHRP